MKSGDYERFHIKIDSPLKARFVFYAMFTQKNYWTISQFWYGGDDAYFIGAEKFEDGFELHSIYDNIYGVHPVISLKSTVTATGTGAWNDPYVVQ